MSKIIHISTHPKYKIKLAQLNDEWEWIGLQLPRPKKQKKPTREELQDLLWYERNPNAELPEKLKWVKDYVEKKPS